MLVGALLLFLAGLLLLLAPASRAGRAIPTQPLHFPGGRKRVDNGCAIT